MNSERLSKFISHCGIASRRKSEEIIISGRIKVNNNIILEPFYNVDCNKDIVTLDNNILIKIKHNIYISLYKPVGYISDLKDTRGRKLARDLIDIDSKLFPIGRLDYNSEGLMMFTNDGPLANKIMHPKYGVEKEYLVKFKGLLSDNDIRVVKKGIVIEGIVSQIKDISFFKASFKNNWYKIILHEGRNRIIRKIGYALGHEVLKLKRVRIGHIKLGNLKLGTYKFLSKKEIMPFNLLQD